MKRNPPGFYVYALLDPRRPGRFIYGDIKFDCEPFYIGKGKNNRMFRHLTDKRKTHTSFRVQRIRAEVGLEAVTVCLQANLSEEEAFKLERELVMLVGRRDNGRGPLTNKCDGGRGVARPAQDEDRRRAISRALTGRKQSAETKARRAAKLKGHVTSEETKKKVSAALKDRPRITGWHHSDRARAAMRKPKSPEAIANMTIARRRRGSPVSEEVRGKIRAKLKGRPLSEETKAKMRGRTPWNKRLVIEARA